jgi:hypothetical protein
MADTILFILATIGWAALFIGLWHLRRSERRERERVEERLRGMREVGW